MTRSMRAARLPLMRTISPFLAELPQDPGGLRCVDSSMHFLQPRGPGGFPEWGCLGKPTAMSASKIPGCTAANTLIACRGVLAEPAASAPIRRSAGQQRGERRSVKGCIHRIGFAL